MAIPSVGTLAFHWNEEGILGSEDADPTDRKWVNEVGSLDPVAPSDVSTPWISTMGPNGLRCLNFGGDGANNDHMKVDGVDVDADWSLAVSFKQESGAGNDDWLMTNYADSNFRIRNTGGFMKAYCGGEERSTGIADNNLDEHYIVMRCKSSGGELWVDGSQVGASDLAWGNNLRGLVIGMHSGLYNAFYGKVGEIAVWSDDIGSSGVTTINSYMERWTTLASNAAAIAARARCNLIMGVSI